jgi:hypothetical protein
MAAQIDQDRQMQAAAQAQREASAAKYRAAASSWMGATRAQVLASWGVPTSTSDDGQGGTILQYNFADPLPVQRTFYLNANGVVYNVLWKG